MIAFIFASALVLLSGSRVALLPVVCSGNRVVRDGKIPDRALRVTSCHMYACRSQRSACTCRSDLSSMKSVQSRRREHAHALARAPRAQRKAVRLVIVRYTSTSMYVQSTEYCCVGVALVWNKLPGIDPHHVRLQGVLLSRSVLRTSLSCKSVTFSDVDFQQESGVVFFLKCLHFETKAIIQRGSIYRT